MSVRQAVLVVARNLPPLCGGMERVNERVVTALAEEFQVVVCGPTGARERLSGAFQVAECPVRPLWRYVIACQLHALKLAIRHRPLIVFAGSGLTAPAAWVAARATGALMITYVHGLDLVAEHPIYRSAFLPIVRRSDRLIANSRNTLDLAIAAGVKGQTGFVVNPGVDPVTEVDPCASVCVRSQMRAEGSRVMLSVGRLTPRKGLLQFVEQTLPRIVSCTPQARLVVVGGEPVNALLNHSRGMTQAILDCAREAGVLEYVTLLGELSDAELHAAFRCSDVHVFPVQQVQGDVEGFGMVALEAAVHGVPTVAFDVGGVADAVANGVSGTLVPAGDHDAFARAVVNVLEARAEFRASRIRGFAAEHSWARFDSEILAHVHALVSDS